ncbi:restriction endonuclease subunit S [Micromonospora coerulea]|uniref:restriction endonuclease subunit S n=1 Tax=Micromonospora coerulea TaxID=47856 RepID=UPI0019037A45|nr:restriction endonuclease subunit S [Micromonospora veneta]
MSLNLDKSGWKPVALGDVIKHVTDRVDPETSGLERFLAGEHIPSNSLHITKWGVIGRDPIGPMFYKRFRPGHVLYVSRRSYLRKTAVPEFEGITGEKTFVLETRDPSVLLQEFMPFLLSAEAFHSYAVANSRGSVNPYVNWTDLANYQFDLPSLDEQKRLADLLWAVERHSSSLAYQREVLLTARTGWLSVEMDGLLAEVSVPFEKLWIRSPQSGWSARPVDQTTGRYVLSLAALGPDGYREGQLKNVLDSPELRPVTLAAGDLLISRANTVEAVGRAGIFDEPRDDVSFPDTMMRLRLVSGIQPRFAEAVISSSHGRAHMRRTAAGSATSMVKINRQSLAKLAFPAVSVDRQEQLLRELSRFDGALTSVDRAIADAKAVKSGILVQVFGDGA